MGELDYSADVFSVHFTVTYRVTYRFARLLARNESGGGRRQTGMRQAKSRRDEEERSRDSFINLCLIDARIFLLS